MKATFEWDEQDVYAGRICIFDWYEGRECLICREENDLLSLIDIKIGTRVRTPKPFLTAQEMADFLSKHNVRPEVLG